MKAKFLSIILTFAVAIGTIPVFAEPPESTPEPPPEFVIDEDGVLIAYNGNGGDVIIPDGVTAIKCGFHGEETITSLVIPDGVEKILTDDWFYGYEALTTVVIGGGLTYIEDKTFLNCVNLTSVVIKNGTKLISRRMFDGTGIVTITVPESIAEIGDMAFANCESLESVVFKATAPPIFLPNGDEAGDFRTFRDSTNLNTIYVRIGAKEAYEAVEMLSEYNIIEVEFCEQCDELIDDCDCENRCEHCGALDCEIKHYFCEHCGKLDCVLVHIYCDICGALDCEIKHYCEACGILDCIGPRPLGQILGNGFVSILDIMEIYQYLIGLESILDIGSESCAFKASLILGGKEPSHWDARELSAHIAGFPCVIDGAIPLELIQKNVITVKAVVDEVKKEIRYYADKPLKQLERYSFELIVKDCNVSYLSPIEEFTVDFHSALTGGAYCIILGAKNDIPTNQPFMRQSINDVKSLRKISLSGDVITEVIKLPRMGDIDGDGEITLFDFIELLAKLVGLPSKVDTDDFSYKAALIKKEPTPTIFDGIEILCYLLKIPNEVDPKVVKEDPQYR